MKFLLLPCLLAISAFGYVLVDNLKVSAGVERTLKMAAEMRRGLGEGKEDVYGQFTDFIVKFEREYKDEQEVAQRFEIIEKSLKRIAELQKQSPTAQFGLTKMADLSEEEFGRIANLKVPARNEDEEQDFLQLDISEEDLPKGHDWRKLNGVSSVKNQGDCGACFAFGTVGAIESQWRIKR
uniref:Inhibitor_I29 domain-containing protein n=2 Tax=Bursaphelenchus xylophilus TaxID=6326 RepID=A0A1I7SI31_BURXY